MAQQQADWEPLRGPRERPVQALVSPLEDRDGFEAFRYMTNIGLALKEVLVEEEGAIAYSLINFNALPAAYMPKRRSLSEALWLPTVVVGLLLVVAGIWAGVYLRGQNSSLTVNVDDITGRTQELGVLSSDVTALQGQLTTADAVRGDLEAMLNGLAVNRDGFDTNLAEVYVRLPGGVSLSSVTVSATTITISGTASDETSVFDYAWGLNESGRFASVLVGSISGGGGEISFTMTLGRA